GVAPAATTIHTATGADHEWAQLTVSDSGPGVPEPERKRIFERFQRGSTSGGRSGFGLGLAIGRELATRMGGTLELDLPVSPGEDIEARLGEDRPGASFTLRLPVAHLDQEDP
ncbi:MAG: sensor histidine kinase, partial [Solirubrobacteraceae bacterium]